MRTLSTILKDIDQFQPKDDNWLELDNLLEELWETENAEQGLKTLLAILERFPEDDGEGVLWSIVHGIESIAGYEGELVSSLQRQPSEMGLILLHRIENTAERMVARVKIQALYKELLDHPKLPTSLNDTLLDFIMEE